MASALLWMSSMEPMLDTPIADIATRVPGAARVFERHHFDFCCRGRETLAEVCAEHALDPHAVAAEIAAVPSPDDAVR